MANTTILQLPVAIGLTGDEWIEIVQDGVSKRIQLSQLQVLYFMVNFFEPLPDPPVDTQIGAVYFDTTLGYPRIYCEDGQWHGMMLS